jgi:hypothetical protein
MNRECKYCKWLARRQDGIPFTDNSTDKIIIFVASTENVKSYVSDFDKARAEEDICI